MTYGISDPKKAFEVAFFTMTWVELLHHTNIVATVHTSVLAFFPWFPRHTKFFVFLVSFRYFYSKPIVKSGKWGGGGGWHHHLRRSLSSLNILKSLCPINWPVTNGVQFFAFHPWKVNWHKYQWNKLQD